MAERNEKGKGKNEKSKGKRKKGDRTAEEGYTRLFLSVSKIDGFFAREIIKLINDKVTRWQTGTRLKMLSAILMTGSIITTMTGINGNWPSCHPTSTIVTSPPESTLFPESLR